MTEGDRRRARAEARRGRIVLRKGRLSDPEQDPVPLDGPDAVSLVAALTRESWALAGLPMPEYTRAETPYRFVPGHGE